jgi:nucleotide-binding universal stress UspA family protein
MDVQRARRPVVVGVDGSESSTQAVRWAAREAGRRRAPLRVVEAVGHAGWPIQDADPRFGSVPHELRARVARAHLEAAERAAVEEVPGVAVERRVLDGFPAVRLVDESRAAQLVVVGSHGRGSLGSLLLGSVSQAVLHRADCPVVVVRGEAAGERG